MLKCCKARFDVIVARPCEWIASFDFDECSELRGIMCIFRLFETANVLPFNDKRDVGIAIDGVVSKPKLLSTDADSSVVGEADSVNSHNNISCQLFQKWNLRRLKCYNHSKGKYAGQWIHSD